MSTTVKTGWLKDKEGNKFAPKTLSSQIQTSDGILLEDKIKADLDAAKTEILENVTVPVDDTLSSTSENPVQNKVLNSEFEEISIAMNVLEQSIDGKADKTHSHDDLYYTESEIDAALDGKANSEHTHILTDVSSTNASWEYIDGSNLEDLLMSIDSDLNSLSSTIVDNPKFVTPQMYGAVGDGVTDDTAAFTQALAENDSVYVPSGNYLITSALNLTYKKGLYSDDGQRATIYFTGNDSVVNLGRLSVFRNINIRLKNAFVGTVFNTHNHLVNSGQSALESRVGNVNVYFEVASPDAVLIGITVDSGTDPNTIPRLRGVCYQTYHDICVEYGSESYGIGIKMELIQGRAFTEETKEGYPWITHIDYDDIFLGSPYTAIKAGATVAEGVEYFERVGMGHLLFNNVSTQYRTSTSTRYFLDVNHFGGYFTKCIGWDYYPLGWGGEKCNIIGEDVSICLSDCEMEFGKEFLKSCDFTAETEFSVENNPEYFVKKYFGGTVLRSGYDSVDAKIDSRLTDAYVGEIAEEKVNEILYSGYANILDDPLTQIKVGLRWSNSEKNWTAGAAGADKKTTLIIPIVSGGNIIRWSPSSYVCGASYQSVYFFNNDDLTDGIHLGSFSNLWNSDGGYLQIDNPSGYKYASIPFNYYTDISSETMIMTINREITSDSGQSYTEYLNEKVIAPAVTEAVKSIVIPTKTSELTNDSGFLTEIPYIVGNSTAAGAWTGTYEGITEYRDGLTVLYKTNIAGVSGGTTLDINGLGAIPVHRNASTAVTTTYPVGSVLVLTYSDGAWLTADYDANTKNTAGTSNKADTKMYLVGATSQTSSGTTTYTNKSVYIGTDNCLYSNNEKVVTSSEITGKVDKTDSLTLTGVDADGNTHTWTVYGKVVS